MGYDVRYGSLVAPQNSTIPTAAIEGEAATKIAGLAALVSVTLLQRQKRHVSLRRKVNITAHPMLV